MKKIFVVLMALMALTFTQCKPDNGNEGGDKIRVRCDVPISNSTGTRSDFSSLMSNDSIFWSTGVERLYLAVPGSSFQIVELTANNATPQANVLEFEGEVDEDLLVDGKEYEIWYFGNSKNLGTPYITENKEGGVIKGISGSIATQSGSLSDLGYCHIAKTTVKAKLEGSEVVLPLRGVLNTTVAIAYLDLANITSLDGEAILGTEYNFQYNGTDFEFVVTEDPTASINVTNGTSKSHIILFPNGTNNVRIECKRGARELAYEFKKGLEPNKFYYRFISDKERAVLKWEETEIEDNYSYVDLDLPSGNLWAECNIGASKPEEFGDYYAWGEIETKEVYNIQTSLNYGKKISDFQGDPTYDVAAYRWGGDWRMPNSNDLYELANPDNCIWQWTTQNGVVGYLVTSKHNGKTLFFPAAGCRIETDVLYAGSDGYYYGSAPQGAGTENAYMIWFNESQRTIDGCARVYGNTIRPVKPINSGGGTITIPTVTTDNVTAITNVSATCGGNVTSDGNVTVTERGVCWNTTGTPTVSDNKLVNGSGKGSFVCNLTALTPNTTYYVRAYAINSQGISYGEQKTFKTYERYELTVLTREVSNITPTTATCGGEVTMDGGNAVTARGVCWSTSQNPTISNSKTVDGTGTGAFNSSLINLIENTTYYVRAYATNSTGTVYGEQKTFTTLAIVAPIVKTNDVSSVQGTTAVCGGNVTSDGGAAVTARGVCWNTTGSPTIANSKTTDGTGTGVFTSTILGLSKNTTYYVRAYATNSKGTSYGEERTFTTVGEDAKSIVFAEGVSASSGWYDVNKLKIGGGDINMCWAASASNIIQWWQDRYVAAGNSLPAGAVTGPGTKEYDGVGKYNLALMELYRDLWWNEKGGDTDHGIVWYFEGRNIQETATPESHAQPNSSTSGGYFSSVWSQILPRIYKYDKIVVQGVVEYHDLISTEFNNYYIWGGGSGLTGDARLKKFSDLVVEFIGRGPASFVISLNSNGGLLHATTLWGYEIDNSTGMITKLWITDSDDMHQSGNGDPTVQLLREYSVSYDASSGKVKLSGAPYGSCWAISLFPVSGYGSN